ncbi:hypothetical protein [Permianibacter fluminis]|nr:hypothetical protein [Permianibacter fluminis]
MADPQTADSQIADKQTAGPPSATPSIDEKKTTKSPAIAGLFV